MRFHDPLRDAVLNLLSTQTVVEADGSAGHKLFCTMPILFHKLEGFPGKMPWGLPVTLAVTKPGL